MTSVRKTPEEAVAAVEAADAARSGSSVEAAYRDLVSIPKKDLAENSARTGPRLAGLLSQMPPWYASVYVGAELVGDQGFDAASPRTNVNGAQPVLPLS